MQQTRARDQTKAATEARANLGSVTDIEILGKLTENPGSSVYQIAKELNCAVGRVDGSVSRLHANGKVDVRYVLKEGRVVKELYPKGFVETPSTEIRLDKELLENSEKWKEKAFLYALDRLTIGVAPSESKEWSEKALAREEVVAEKQKDDVVLKLPERLSDFYLWKNSASEVTVVGDHALITTKTRIPINVNTEKERLDFERFSNGRFFVSISVRFSPPSVVPSVVGGEPRFSFFKMHREPQSASIPMEIVAEG